MKIDEIFEHVGNFGRYHKILYVIVFLAGIPNALIMFLTYYSHYERPFHCKLPNVLRNIKNQSRNELLLNLSIPMEVDSRGNRVRSECYMYERNYTLFENDTGDQFIEAKNATYPIQKCDNGYTFETENGEVTAVTKYSMVCEESWKMSFVASLVHVGLALGSFVGTLADRFGRRPVFLCASILQVLLTILISFSWDYYSYAVFMLFAGCAQFVNYITAFVLASEVTAVKWRNFFAISSFFSYALGICIESAIGYFFRNWRHMLWAVSALSTCIYLPCYWLFPESARWLIVKGRMNNGTKELKKMAKMNKSPFSVEDFLKDYEPETTNQEEYTSLVRETVKAFFRSEISARYLSVFFTWFAVGLAYYGISLFSTDFSENRHLNLFFCGVAEFPALLAGYYAVKWIGRPRTAFWFLIICGITSLVLPFMDASVLRTVVAMSGKGAVSVGFYIAYFLAAESAPTLHRSTAMNVASFCARLGAVIAPFLMHMEKQNHFLPNLVMGSAAIFSGILCIFFIPETKGVPLPDTVTEAARNKRIYGFRIFGNLALKDGL